MTFDEQLPTWSDVAQIAVGAVVIYLLLISCSRIIGPRSFSQMTAFDFAVTVAMGAIVGSTATGGIPVYAGALGMVCLFAVRGVVAIDRRHGLDRWFDNRPILVVAGPDILDGQLRKAKVTDRDVLEALRLAGLTSRTQVQAVIIERNGTFSVIRTGDPIDPELVAPVSGSEALRLGEGTSPS